VTKNLYYEPLGTVHYNVLFKSTGLVNRVTERDLCGLRPQDISFVWIVEEKRYAKAEEIREPCKGALKGKG